MRIICPGCRAVHVPGTLFCEQCGTSLLGVMPIDEAGSAGEPLAAAAAADASSPSPDEGATTLPLAAVQDSAASRMAAGAVPTRLRMLVLNTGRLTDWIDEPTIHIGRLDRAASVFPAVDLDADGGHAAGVSRRHARIIRQPDGFYLEDLGSINGTFLNRRRLNPGTPTGLQDGDELRMGNIVLRVVLGGFQHRQ